MSRRHEFSEGGYQFLEGGFPYSAGVIAAPGSRLVRVRFARPPGMALGFNAISAHLRAQARPLTSLCAVELRSPKPFSFAGFHDFNIGYVDVLRQWGLIRNDLNPVARSNVCPVFDPPSEPVFHAFTYTVPALATQAQWGGHDFVVAGSGEWPEGQAFPQAIVARDDVSRAGMAAKVAYVIKTMQERCTGLGGDWQRLTAAQIYTVEDFHPFLASHFAATQLTAAGLSWHLCKPPIVGLEYEMDVRSLDTELVLPG